MNEIMEVYDSEELEIIGARAHNLKNVALRIPRDQLVVFTGISGSGKSSLAFDTIYAEGQRRYLETFSAYARQFLGAMERPEVDAIQGLSPVISIEQKTVSRNPRSTVGTITEIYDFLRLLYARAGEAYSWKSGKKMVRYDEDSIVRLIREQYQNKRLALLAPLVRARKGHYRELLDSTRRKGYLRARIDGKMTDLSTVTQLDRYKVHDIELVIDRLLMHDIDETRLKNSIKTALKMGKGVLMAQDMDTQEIRFFSRKLMCPDSGIAYDDPEPNTFSFNSPYGYCHACKGLGEVDQVDPEKLVPNRALSIKQGALAPWGRYKNSWHFRQVEALLRMHRQKIGTPFEDLPEKLQQQILSGTDEKLVIKSEVGLSDITTQYDGVTDYVERLLTDSVSAREKNKAKDFVTQTTCKKCGGARLKKEALHFKLGDRNIAQVSQMDLDELHTWICELPDHLSEKQQMIAGELIKEIEQRLKFLLDVGLEYLTIDRKAVSLSGGEAQRIRLATQIGSQLIGVLYILDEPSIGLHQRDNQKLIQSLLQLRDLGNSVIVVEHDKDMMMAADHIVDIGPGAGHHGGKIVGQGDIKSVMSSGSLTARYLSGEMQIPVPEVRRKGSGKSLKVTGATGNNLKNVTLELPLGTFICVTGVSGSGKSTLINQTTYPVLSNKVYRTSKKHLPFEEVSGLSYIDKVIEIDQSPIGRTPRSNPATYTKVFDDIRSLFASVPEAKIRGYKPGRFSFNTKGGRCETCEGAGIRRIQMNFLPDVYVPCDTCHGKRYNRETLEVRYKGHSVTDVLDMTVEEAVQFFDAHPRISKKLQTLKEVGLGYITLGQQSTTLSGGEAQRVKLAAELSKKDTGRTVYILDEPSTGLHFEDIRMLTEVLNRLVDHGNTVIVIEHNLDIVKMADWIIDMGPEGGKNGGEIIATGTPENLVGMDHSYTGRYLKLEMTPAGSLSKG